LQINQNNVNRAENALVSTTTGIFNKIVYLGYHLYVGYLVAGRESYLVLKHVFS